MVDRKCPTCISLAILGDEKSTTMRCRRDDDDDDDPKTDGIPSRGSDPISRNVWDNHAREYCKLIKPGPAMSMVMWSGN